MFQTDLLKFCFESFGKKRAFPSMTVFIQGREGACRRTIKGNLDRELPGQKCHRAKNRQIRIALAAARSLIFGYLGKALCRHQVAQPPFGTGVWRRFGDETHENTGSDCRATRSIESAEPAFYAFSSFPGLPDLLRSFLKGD